MAKSKAKSVWLTLWRRSVLFNHSVQHPLAALVLGATILLCCAVVIVLRPGGQGVLLEESQFRRNAVLDNIQFFPDMNSLISSTTLIEEGRHFCVPWTANMDDWWTQHYAWRILHQNSTHQCFRSIQTPQRLQFLTNVRKTQFPHREPRSILIKHTSGSGWGIDLSHVIDGLMYAVDNRGVLVHIHAPPNWQYAIGACPLQDWSCYFLPWTNHSLPPSSLLPLARPNEIRHLYDWRGFAHHHTQSWLLEYATRAQTWLRRDAVQLAEMVLPLNVPNTNEPDSCVVFHVRRGDVVLHGKFSRRYHAIAEYVRAYEEYRTAGNAAGSLHNPDILLLTDDANAVVEATTLFPQYVWHSFVRRRYGGASGGWEHHIPSGNATLEVTVLQATTVLLQSRCNSLMVHSKSNLADYWYANMLQGNPRARRVDLDAEVPHDKVHAAENAASVQLSRQVF